MAAPIFGECLWTALLCWCQAAQQQLRLAMPLLGPRWWPLHPFLSSAGVLQAAAGSSVIALLLLPSAVRDSSNAACGGSQA